MRLSGHAHGERAAELPAKCYYAMSQPVKLPDEIDEIVLDAWLTAEVAQRSIAGQIEFWAQLGRAIEPLLEGSRALALRRAGAPRQFSDCLARWLCSTRSTA